MLTTQFSRTFPTTVIGWLLFAAAVGIMAPCLAAEADPFAEGVRSTPWRSPADEQKTFKLPDGFEIQLVAAEPDIQKPLNMAFDERGRIWLTCTVEYPYAVPVGQPGRDTIRVLEDTDGDGRFEKVTVFADGLNIPMGIYPWKGGCIAYSIPYLWQLEDTDGDGVCDKRTKLYGPFDHTRDTHGMINGLRRGFDGWLYACHGFNNDSRVKGTDGNEVHMQSGNTFRVRLDGSRIEHFSHGQVNPFGMTLDERFNLFTADCHSKPIYQLLRGGYYPSFGKPHDGLGFVPPMMDHLHGSTAIAGLAYYSGANFPPQYRGQMFSGNVMTSRVNRNALEYHGSTIRAVEQPDFVIAGDPWFRPVDIQIGPDGALYILDFYNRIIGHYEVPLTHPGRDRTSGRIWRVVYQGDSQGTQPANLPGDLTQMSVPQLVTALDHESLAYRLLATNWLVDTLGEQCVVEVLAAFDAPRSSRQQVHALWVLERLAALDDERLHAALKSPHADVRVHALKVLGERKTLPTGISAADALADSDPFVVRAAAEVAGRHPNSTSLKSLVTLLLKVPADDTHLRYAIRRAICDQLEPLPTFEPVHELARDASAARELASIAVAVPTPAAAEFLVARLERHDEPRPAQLRYLEHAAKHLPVERVGRLVDLAQAKLASEPEIQKQMLDSLHAGLSQRGVSPAPELIAWGVSVAKELLAYDRRDVIPWTHVPVDSNRPSADPWVVQERKSRDGRSALFFSSLPQGEQLTGVYRSGPFTLPGKLSFWCAGHSGPPPFPLNDKNWIRLRDAVTHEVLVEARPTRNDTAQRIEWDLAEHAGQRGYLELVDADTASGFAWLAVGRFSVEGLNPSRTAPRQVAGAELAGKLQLSDLKPALVQLLTSQPSDTSVQRAAGAALVQLEPDARAAALVVALGDATFGPVERRATIDALQRRGDEEFATTMRLLMKAAPLRLQASMADALAGDERGAALLIQLIREGHTTGSLAALPNIGAKVAVLKSQELKDDFSRLAATGALGLLETEKLLAERRQAFLKSSASTERGAGVFAKHCAACHQIAGKGQTIGPQLDGIGNRGLERIVEDILAPNRNVDVAFRTTTLQLADGRVVSGLVRREEGKLLVLVDQQGKEFSLAQEAIEQQRKSELSLMPANVSEILTTDQLHDLLAYLLAQRGTPPSPE